MNKSALTLVLGILLVLSLIFNLVQYHEQTITNQKLTAAQSAFGPNEKISDQLSQQKYQQDHSIVLYLKTTTSDAQAIELENSIKTQPTITSADYTSPAQAIANFKSQHSNDPAIAQSLKDLGSNPLPGTINIKISDPSQKQSVINFIKSKDKNSLIANISSI